MHWLSADQKQTDVSFADLNLATNRFANALKSLNVQKGEVVFTYLPKSVQLFEAFLGTLKAECIGGTLFANFGESAVFDRLDDSKAAVLITNYKLFNRIRNIRNQLTSLRWIILVEDQFQEHANDTLLWKDLLSTVGYDFHQPQTPPDTPSVLHYTSGSTGKPKGVLHTHNSIVHQARTSQSVLCLKHDDIYWCTADQGWITGTSYGIIGPWCLGITQVHYGGGYNARRWYELIQMLKISVWYTAPTALRMLMHEDKGLAQEYDLRSLDRIYSVGEPLNPEVISWCNEILHKPVFDTWFQTETGAIMIANTPEIPVRPGSMGKPVTGIEVAILADDGSQIPHNEYGNLCIKSQWPSMFITYLNNTSTYNSKFAGEWYYTGDKARCDHDGYFWFQGRADDVINTSGHLVSPFEVESVLLELPEILESGVIGVPDQLLFEKVVVFVTLPSELLFDSELVLKIQRHVESRLSAIAVPHEVYAVSGLPKNKSGKIMRRVLKARYLGEEPGDISTIDDGGWPIKVTHLNERRELTQEILFENYPDIDMTLPVKDSLDSLAFVQLTVFLSEYGMEIVPEDTPLSILERYGHRAEHAKVKVLSIVSLMDNSEERFVITPLLNDLAGVLQVPVHFEHLVVPRIGVLLQDIIFHDCFMPLNSKNTYADFSLYVRKIKRAGIILVGSMTELRHPPCNDYLGINPDGIREPDSAYVALRWGGYFQNHHRMNTRVHRGASFDPLKLNDDIAALEEYLQTKIFRVCYESSYSPVTDNWDFIEPFDEETYLHYFAGGWWNHEPYDFSKVQAALFNFVQKYRHDIRLTLGDQCMKLIRAETNHYCGWLVPETVIHEALKKCEPYNRIGFGGPPCSLPALQNALHVRGKIVSFLQNTENDPAHFDFVVQTGFGEMINKESTGCHVMDHPLCHFARYVLSRNGVTADVLKNFLVSDVTPQNLADAERLIGIKAFPVARCNISRGTRISADMLEKTFQHAKSTKVLMDLILGAVATADISSGEHLGLGKFSLEQH